MECRIFYSWQSDLPNKTNRSFIAAALEKAAKSIRDDDSIQIEPVIDRDTLGIPGSPDIANTIFGKIEQSQVFVCDVSIINQGADSRQTPNPNVLIELGYAVKTLGWDRILMVINTAYGGPEILPFDLRMRRFTAYRVSALETDKSAERKNLERGLEAGLRSIFTQVTSQEPLKTTISEQARAAIEQGMPNQVLLTRAFMASLVKQLDELNPDFSHSPEDQWCNLLTRAIQLPDSLIVEFARLAQNAAIADSFQAASEIHKSFGEIVSRYYLPRDFSGYYIGIQFDFYKFIGHELFVIFIACLIREERWETIGRVLEGNIFVENFGRGRPETKSYSCISRRVELLDCVNQRSGPEKPLFHARILRESYSEELAQIVSLREFVQADYFLYLRAELAPEEVGKRGDNEWAAWSAILIGNEPPKFLVNAIDKRYALRLSRALGMTDLEIMRDRLVNRARNVRYIFRDISVFFTPFEDFNLQDIASC